MKKVVFTIVSASVLVCLSESSFAQKTRKVDFAKKIADATPAELPQSPVEVRAGSDARDEGLKGKIMSVIEYTQSVGSRNRDLYREEYYDGAGNLTKSVHYDIDGYPDSVIVYGYIDKMRVTRSGDVTYAPGEKPPAKHMIISVRAEDNARNPSWPRDTRYRTRLTHDYDANVRLIEERLIQNNGEMWSKNTYTYDGNLRTERIFNQDGGEMSKTVYVLDASGNEIEQRMYVNDKVANKYFMTYEFDSQGNWIKQKTFEEVTVRKKKIRKPLWVSYRTISYYN